MPQPNPQIIAWVKRLNSPSKSTRLEAIRGLEDIGIADALYPLAAVFASDPDEEVRRLAQQVGKIIYANLHRQATTPRAASAEERQQAGDILAKAHAQKKKRR